MRVAMLTKEYPPEIYGGAGVHVTELTRFMRNIVPVDVHCMGQERSEHDVYVHSVDPALENANPALRTLSTGLRMAHATHNADIVHSHTWYSGLGGHLSAQLHSIPHVVTAHSLEPDRPWKKEQLGGGYNISSWSERNAMEYADAIIAVSAKMKQTILHAYPRIDADKVHVILNGIDTQLWQPRPTFDQAQHSILHSLGVDPQRPIIAFVGRITRQKGVEYLIKAAHLFSPDAQLILCAGAPDTPEIAKHTAQLVHQLQAQRTGVIWVETMLPQADIQEILSAADVFVCPSIYEPLGIVNLEAMACATAVVASDVGGIPEVVADGVTGTLVHYDPADTNSFVQDLAHAVNALISDATRVKNYGIAGRQRAMNDFSWEAIAAQTVDLYHKLV
ncbi:glycogen synthase [Corynebacterium sp. sy017]|uniref:glycogen synthase n=1 Tax=unclassified Corynebacterium TaxID=2624378 RepID=UPI001186F60B|nr:MULTISPECIES: glycogen synthase [unclassified Corynebacterium]MBP3088962.1 glycogen synthase [Corynebacterium sp. sy017]TSD91287.1 glycogen synthase [Corynebacterium sp. SY003]